MTGKREVPFCALTKNLLKSGFAPKVGTRKFRAARPHLKKAIFFRVILNFSKEPLNLTVILSIREESLNLQDSSFATALSE